MMKMNGMIHINIYIDINISFQVEAIFVIIADFESILKPVNQPSGDHSMKKDEHVACLFHI